MRQAKLGKPSHLKGKKLSLEHREKVSKSLKKFFAQNNPNYIPYSHDDRKRIRRERIKVYGGSHSIGEWETLKAQYNWTCPGCGKYEPEIKLTRDHIVAISKGGSDNIENIQPLCVSCNSKKSTRAIRY
jgi:5-methylcytosine-specific restriction endonuclease McrA